MRKFFLSFADSRMSRALARVRQQAEEMGCYDHIVVADQSYLDISFREKYKDKLTPAVRGYGYWCWKPQVILQLLAQVNEGDIIQYTDAGCHLNKAGQARLMDYFQFADQAESGILAFAAIPPEFHDPSVVLPDLTEWRWCKADLFKYFGVSDNAEITQTPTIGAGIIFIKKNKQSQKILEQWRAVVDRDFSLIDDSPSKEKNQPQFVEHRHDQSIFSILCKVHGVALVSAYEYGYPSKHSNTPNWTVLKNFPIHAKRDKALSLPMRIIDIAKKVERRLKRLMA